MAALDGSFEGRQRVMEKKEKEKNENSEREKKEERDR